MKWFKSIKMKLMEQTVFEDVDGTFEHALKKGMKNPEDWMYMRSSRFKDYFKHYWTRDYKEYWNLSNLFKF